MRWVSPTHITEETKKAGDLLKATQLVSLGEGSTCLLTEPMLFQKPEFWDQAPKLHPHPHATSCPCPGSVSPPASPSSGSQLEHQQVHPTYESPVPTPGTSEEAGVGPLTRMCEVDLGEWLSFSDSQPQGSQNVQEGGWGGTRGKGHICMAELGPQGAPTWGGKGG